MYVAKFNDTVTVLIIYYYIMGKIDPEGNIIPIYGHEAKPKVS